MTELSPLPEGHFLATSEAMAEGQPDKVADQIAEAVVDAYLAQDPENRVACDVVTKTGMIMIFGSVSLAHQFSSPVCIDFDKVVREAVKSMGYNSTDKGLDYLTMEIVNRLDVRVQEQSSQNADLDDMSTENHGIVFGYATNETPEMLPLTHQLANKLCEMLQRPGVRKRCNWLRPDGKAQVTMEYRKDPDGSVRPVRVHTVVMSVQHAPDVNYDRLRGEVTKNIIRQVIPASFIDENTTFLVNPSGRFVIGGPRGDAGVSGRQGVADTFGAWAPRGGGTPTGRDGYKVHRCGAYAARWVAKSLVRAGFASRCTVQIAYSPGKATPQSLSVDSHGSARCGLSDEDLSNIVSRNFDLRPSALVRDLQLGKPGYLRLATFGQVGRETSLPKLSRGDLYCARPVLWENCKDLSTEATQVGIRPEMGIWQ